MMSPLHMRLTHQGRSEGGFQGFQETPLREEIKNIFIYLTSRNYRTTMAIAVQRLLLYMYNYYWRSLVSTRARLV